MLILALAAVVRVAGMDRQSYTMDEVTEIGIAARPVASIVTLADGFPPLYHLALSPWQTLAPPCALSVLLGLITVLGAYLLASELGGRRAGLVYALVIALSPFQVWYAQEARAYALVLPLAMLSLWTFARARRTGRTRDWLGHAAVSLAGLYSHYYFAILVAINAMWAIIDHARTRQTPYGARVAGAIVILGSLPVAWLVTADLAHQSGTLESRLTLIPIAYSVYAFVLGFATGLSVRELHTATSGEALLAFAPWLLATVTCLLPLLPGARRLAAERPRDVAWLATLVATPLIACAAASVMFAVKYKPSYVAWASLPLAMLVSWIISREIGRSSVKLGVVGLAVLMVTSLTSRQVSDRYRNEALHEVAGYLREHASRTTPVLVSPPYMTSPLRYYLGREWKLAPIDGDDANAVRKLLHSEYWLVYARPFHGDPDGTVLRVLEQTERVERTKSFAGVELFSTEAPGEHGAARGR